MPTPRADIFRAPALAELDPPQPVADAAHWDRGIDYQLSIHSCRAVKTDFHPNWCPAEPRGRNQAEHSRQAVCSGSK
jgi:hypothetical protein